MNCFRFITNLFFRRSIILETAVKTRILAQHLDLPSYIKNCLTTNKVTSKFFITLVKPICYTKNSRLTAVSRIICVCVLLVQSFMLPSAYAWNEFGHMIVAQIAYDQMTPDVKKKASRLTHVVGNFFPSTASFVSSAAWADEIKANGVKAFNNWHFINQRFSYVRIRMPKYVPRENVVWAINQSDKVLYNSDANLFEKSLFLRFLVHFAGDAHQPTQCSNFYSWQFPKGDNGGTKFSIHSDVAKNLHQFWDRGLGYLVLPEGKKPTGEDVKKFAQELEKKYPPSFFGNQSFQTNPKTWAKESLKYSQNFVYKHLKPYQTPKEEYVKRGQEITEQRLALAGYRLANLLNELLGSQPDRGGSTF